MLSAGSSNHSIERMSFGVPSAGWDDLESLDLGDLSFSQEAVDGAGNQGSSQLPQVMQAAAPTGCPHTMQVAHPISGGPSTTAVQPQPVAPAAGALTEEQKQRMEANKVLAVERKRQRFAERMGSAGVRAPQAQAPPQPAADSGSQQGSSREMSQDSQSQGANMKLSRTPEGAPVDADLVELTRLQPASGGEVELQAPLPAAGAAPSRPEDAMYLSQETDDDATAGSRPPRGCNPSLQLARQLQGPLPQRQLPAAAAAHARATVPPPQPQPPQHQPRQRQLRSTASARAKDEEVYVLRLRNKVRGRDCYYIGKAKDKAQRIEQHRSGGPHCAKWVERQGGVAAEVRPIIGLDAGLDADSWEQKETIAWVIRLSTARARPGRSEPTLAFCAVNRLFIADLYVRMCAWRLTALFVFFPARGAGAHRRHRPPARLGVHQPDVRDGGLHHLQSARLRGGRPVPAVWQ
jgi:hypothetical protein